MFDDDLIPEKFLKGGPLPEALGRCADLYKDVRDFRLLLDKQVNAVKAREAEIKNHLIENIPKSDNTGMSGLRYRAQVVTKVRPQVEDWDAFRNFILDSQRLDMLQKRLSDKAIKDAWEAGEDVPGVGEIIIPDVSITKIK